MKATNIVLLIDQALSILNAVSVAQARGDDVTDAEVDALFAADDVRRASFQAKIDAKKAGG